MDGMISMLIKTRYLVAIMVTAVLFGMLVNKLDEKELNECMKNFSYDTCTNAME